MFSVLSITAGVGSLVNNTTDARVSVLLSVIDGFHRTNSLCGGTLNCFSTAALSASATNEDVTFKEAMQQEDKRDFIKQCCLKYSLTKVRGNEP